MPFVHKIQADLYRIDSDTHIGSTANTIASFIQNHINNPRHSSYNEIELIPEAKQIKDFELQLFVSEVNDRTPDWLDFAHEIATPEGQSTLNGVTSKYPSLLLFVFNDEVIYVVAKGGGRHVIAEYIVEHFGVEVLERLIDHNESDIKGVRKRGVIGTTLASDKYFKRNYKLSDEQSFGEYYKSVQAMISREALSEKLGLETTRSSLTVSGENTLKIASSLKLDDIVDRVTRVHNLLGGNNEGKSINKFVRLNKSMLQRVVGSVTQEELMDNELLSFYYNEFGTNTLDIYHPDIFEYVRAETIRFSRGQENKNLEYSSFITLEAIFDAFQISNPSFDQFTHECRAIECRLVYDDDERGLYRTNLLKWLTGEIEYDGKRYFKFDGAWYKYLNDFIQEIELRVENVLNRIGNQEDLPNWIASDNEGIYNEGFRIKSDFLVCDKVQYKGIEICDFMKMENDSIKLYHVKKGWGQSIRIVYSQIMNGIRFFSEIRNNDDPQIEIQLRTYYNSIKQRHYQNTQIPITWTLFRNRLLKNKVTFVLVFGSENNVDRNSQIISSRSNIAKLSIIQCENELRTQYDCGFEITKIQIV